MIQQNALSWQTGVLTFRNTSLQAIQQDLQNQYDAEVLMYSHMIRPQSKLSDELQEEVRLVLYMHYAPDQNDLAIRAWQVAS